MADSTAGGRQVDGFHGISIEYMRSPKFLQADGGWSRIVWMPAVLKERVKDFIPKEVVDKISTENDVKTVEELKRFLETKGHPVVQRWEVAPAEAPSAEEKEEVPAVPLTTVPTMPIAGGGFKIILKKARISAKKMVIRTVRKKE